MAGSPASDRWIVDDYFVTGRRVTTWMGDEVVKYHRTVEDYFTTMQAAGFTIESLRESHPQRARFTDDALFARRQRIPLSSSWREKDGVASLRASCDMP